MVQTLESIKGGGGSIKVGTTGKISALMSRELDYMNSAPQKPILSRNQSPIGSVWVSSSATTPKRLRSRTSADEASTSSSSHGISHRSIEIARKTKHCNRKKHQIPMLDADNVHLDGTPIIQKHEKKGSNIVEIVDIKCGNPERTWASPITDKDSRSLVSQSSPIALSKRATPSRLFSDSGNGIHSHDCSVQLPPQNTCLV